MDIVQLAIMLGPLRGAAAGYLVGRRNWRGVGHVILDRPLVVAWLVGGR